MSKSDYGVDAPLVIRNLALVGIAGVLMAIFLADATILGVHMKLRKLGMFVAILFLGEALLMVFYGKVGKMWHRDRMLAMHSWNGTEAVLDVGTGRGLMLIGAAKRLTTGKATGIDIWNAEDLSGNNFEAAMSNAAAEGVSDKILILNANILKAPFDDASFDVVLSNLCLHNIYDKPGRAAACAEIHRVLKAGGMAIISDFRNVKEYAESFKALGMQVELDKPHYFTTFPPLQVLRAVKAA